MSTPAKSATPAATEVSTNETHLHAESIKRNTLQPPEGVAPEVWHRLASPVGDCWHIAERDGQGEVVGTSIRKADGSKTSIPSGKRGLIGDWDSLHTNRGGYCGTAANDPFLICEGASDLAAAMTLGFFGVSVPMAGQCADWVGEAVGHDRPHCVIVEDTGDAGERNTAALLKVLRPRCERLKVLRMPEGVKDLREWCIGGATREMVLSAIEGAGVVKPEPVHGDPVTRCMADVEAREVDWLWERRIPKGRLTLLAGVPGCGKSFITIDLAARVSRGRAMPDGATCEAGAVLLACAEDDPSDTIRPRLEAAGADLARVTLLEGVFQGRPSQSAHPSSFTLENVEALDRALRIGNYALVVIDPIGSYLGAKVDAHRENEIRAVLQPVADLARAHDVAVVLVAHTRKAAAVHADDLVLGSRGFTGLARSVLHCMIHPDDEDRRLLLPGKNNLAKPAPGLALTIGGEPAKVLWDDHPVSMTAAEVLARASGGGGDGARAEAEEWLRDELCEGPKPAVEIRARAESDGIAKRTLDRAKSKLGVVSTREGYASDGRWVWVMPERKGKQ